MEESFTELIGNITHLRHTPRFSFLSFDAVFRRSSSLATCTTPEFSAFLNGVLMSNYNINVKKSSQLRFSGVYITVIKLEGSFFILRSNIVNLTATGSKN